MMKEDCENFTAFLLSSNSLVSLYECLFALGVIYLQKEKETERNREREKRAVSI